MKILYVVRLFSGLQTSLATGQWQPTGVPTIYKMIEALDRGPDAPVFVFACKDDNVTWPERRDSVRTLAGLRHPVLVLAGRRRFPRWLAPLGGPLRELAHALIVARLGRRERPDLVYLDHANVFVAGWLALTTRARIVFRVMGVYPVMRAALDGGRLGLRLLRWCYRRRFALVVCTQDGSGVEPWLARGLRPDVPRIVLLNGLDADSPLTPTAPPAALPADCTVVLFLGKLERAKGALAFAEGFLKAWRQDPSRLHALVIGTGSEAAALEARFGEAGAAEALTLIERLPHGQVMAAMARADIYVSLNRLGNLSNANLEAMASGKAMIFPRAQAGPGIDVVTDQLVPHDAALRIDSADDADGLAAAIMSLHRAPDERRRLGAAIAAATRGFVMSWDQRIGRELDLLRRVAEARDLGSAVETSRTAESVR
ncbi:MAG: glycosyltransferase [Candidatus Eiseniibacteriota bacterium]